MSNKTDLKVPGKRLGDVFQALASLDQLGLEENKTILAISGNLDEVTVGIDKINDQVKKLEAEFAESLESKVVQATAKGTPQQMNPMQQHQFKVRELLDLPVTVTLEKLDAVEIFSCESKPAPTVVHLLRPILSNLDKVV